MEDTIIISIFMGLEGVHAYSAFLPSIFTIRTFVKTPYGRKMIREGEIMATLFLLALSVVTSRITKSYLPFVFAAVAGGTMVAVYEYALCKAPVNTGQDTDADFTQPKKQEEYREDESPYNTDTYGWYKITR